jgi:rubrerythrin
MSAILDRAVANEEAAAAFYRQAAESVSDPRTKEALEGLMRDEVEHKQLIEEFKTGARPLPEGVTSAGSLVEAFGTPDFSTDLSPADAFLLAARKEKLAVEFYESWAKLYPAGEERDLLLGLAEIERRHKARVEAMFSNAAFPEAW